MTSPSQPFSYAASNKSQSERGVTKSFVLTCGYGKRLIAVRGPSSLQLHACRRRPPAGHRVRSPPSVSPMHSLPIFLPPAFSREHGGRSGRHLGGQRVAAPYYPERFLRWAPPPSPSADLMCGVVF